MGDDWNDFIQTPPSLYSAQSPEQYDILASPLQATPLFPGFLNMSRSPSLPVMQGNSIDPNETLAFLGLEPPRPMEHPAPAPFHQGPELECRTLTFRNANNFASAQEFRNLFPPNIPIKNCEKINTSIYSIEFFDLRHALFYRRSMDEAYLNGSILEVRYATPKPVADRSKPPNNGTIVIFHLPNKVADYQLDAIFNQYGEIRQIRGTPSKPNQKFIEYWDTRSSEAALKAMNGKMVLGSKVSIEFSLPGGFRRTLIK